jgi:GNAT superfamily N-acetyltransferase
LDSLNQVEGLVHRQRSHLIPYQVVARCCIVDDLYDTIVEDETGYCSYDVSSEAAAIWNLYVYKEYRGRGRARALLERAIAEIRSFGYDGEIDIEAGPKEGCMSKRDLVAFYERLGLRVLNKNKWKKTPWQRIIMASEDGRGIRLSADEVIELSMDDAIVTKASNDDYEEENGER